MNMLAWFCAVMALGFVGIMFSDELTKMGRSIRKWQR